MINTTQMILNILQKYGWKTFLILVLFFVGRWSIRLVIRKVSQVNQEHIKKHLNRNLTRRAKTIENIIGLMARIVLYTIIFLMILDLFNVKIGPLLAGAGIVGLAVGLGAQRLLQNFFAGFFILIDDQFDVGDEVEINGNRGVVMKMSIHSTVLKSKDKRIIYLPNGSINAVTNFSQGTQKSSETKKDSSH